MATYFGACDAAGTASGSTSNSDSVITMWRAYVCPGSGNQTLAEAAADLHHSSGTPPLRIAVYDAAGTTLLAQGSGTTIANASPDQWIADTLSAITLVGGTSYILAVSFGDGASDHVDETRSDGSYKIIDYATGGFPAALPAADGTFSMYPIRIGVNPAGPGAGADSLKVGETDVVQPVVVMLSIQESG